MKPMTKHQAILVDPFTSLSSKTVYLANKADAVIRELEAERDAARADAERNRVNAERYEFLRFCLMPEGQEEMMRLYSGPHPDTADELDAAIDAARGAP